MYEVHGAVRKSLGRETPAFIRRKAQHDARRAALSYTIKAVARRLDHMAQVNRALGLGRMPTIAARILRELDREGLLGAHIIVAGANALYAYEARTFALHKLWVSERDDRDPLKQPRDASHARVVAELVQTYLRKPFLAKEMPWLPKELRANIKNLKGA
jgi:Nucleotidyltransferase